MKSGLKLIYRFYDDIFLSSCFVLVFLQHLFIVFKLSSISSALYAASFLIVGMWFIFKIIFIFTCNNQQKKYKNNYLCFILCFSIIVSTIFSVILDQLVTTGTITFRFEYYRKLLIFLQVIVFVFLCYAGNFTKTPLFLLKLSCVLFTLFAIVLFIQGRARVWYGFREWHTLTLNFSNPNTCGLVLSVNFSILFYTLLTSHTLLKKIFILFLLLIVSFFLYLTECRNAIIGCLVFLMVIVFLKLFKRNTSALSTVVVLLPILFASFYLLYFYIMDINSIYSTSNSATFNKGNSTRFLIWLEAISELRLNPFIGSYYSSSGGSGVFQWHNTFIDIYAGFGLIVLVLTLLFLIYILSTTFKAFKNKKTRVAFGMMCLAISLGMFEGFPFYSANCLALLSMASIPVAADSYKSVTMNENMCNENNCEIVIVGDNDCQLLQKYQRYLINYQFNCVFLKESCYKSLIDRLFLKIFNLKSDIITTINLVLLIKSLKPQVVEIYSFKNIKLLSKFITLFFRKKAPLFLIFSESNLHYKSKSRSSASILNVLFLQLDQKCQENADDFCDTQVNILRLYSSALFTKFSHYSVDI